MARRDRHLLDIRSATFDPALSAIAVVLIERDQTGRDPGVIVNPSLATSVPSLASVASADLQPVMRLGGDLRFIGTGFDQGTVEVRFTPVGSEDSLVLGPSGLPSASEVTVSLPSGPALAPADPDAGSGLDPGAWRIGTYMTGLSVEDADGRTVITNALPMALAPLCARKRRFVVGVFSNWSARTPMLDQRLVPDERLVVGDVPGP